MRKLLIELTPNQLILVLLLAIASAAMAAPVDPEAALTIARNFASTRHATRQDGRHAIRRVIRKSSQFEPYYIFNIGSDAGFVIVSGDDRAVPILGYADSGCIDINNIPTNMRAWLQGYADEMERVNADSTELTINGSTGLTINGSTRLTINEENANLSPRRAAAGHIIDPMLQSAWNQNAPYNSRCVFNGTTCYTGCVATAMAQVMKYWEYPQRTTATIHGYTTKTTHMSVPAVSAETAFDWFSMKNYYSEDDTSDPYMPMLMLACGASVQTEFGQYASGAVLGRAAEALHTYFGYSTQAANVMRSDYSYDAWQDLIYNELTAGRPVLYGGMSTGGGHAFVVDGYNGYDMFHINWGWGGMCDGFFSLSALKPDTNSGIGAGLVGEGYNQDQDAVIGIEPADGQGSVSIDEAQLTTTSFSVSGKTINATLVNSTGRAGGFDMAFAYLTDAGDFKPFVESGTQQVGNRSSVSYSCNLAQCDGQFAVFGLTDGAYKFFVVSKLHSSSVWKTTLDMETEYVDLVISGGYITRLALHSDAEPELSAEPQPVTSQLVVGERGAVTFNVTNSGGTFQGTLYLWDQQQQLLSTTQATIPTGHTVAVTFYFTPSQAQSYLLQLSADNPPTDILTSISLTAIASEATVGNITVTRLTYNDQSSPTMLLGTTMSGYANIYNNSTRPFHGTLNIVLMESDDQNGSFSATQQQPVSVNLYIPGSSAIGARFEFADLQIGKWYMPYMYVDDVELRANNSDARQMARSITIYDESGQATTVAAAQRLTLPAGTTAVDLRGIVGLTDIEGGNPNTLFLCEDGSTELTINNVNFPNQAPNIIRGMVCEQLTLTDGYPLVPPFDFTATEVTYFRTFDTGYGLRGGGWSTIALPFDVHTVKAKYGNDFYTIDWFHSPDQERKQFWLMAFRDEQNGVTTFSHASQMVANTPYIITVPNAEWGASNALTDTPIAFYGSNALISAGSPIAAAGSRFSFEGTTAGATQQGVYTLSTTTGDRFTRQNTATINPFRAYMRPIMGAYYTSLTIEIVGGSTNGVMDNGQWTIHNSQFTIHNSQCSMFNGQWYDLSGRPFKNHDSSVHKGIYIRKGKKFVR